MKPTIVHLDYETQSACDLRACGTWVYSEHPSTRAYCAAMKIEYPTGAVQRVFWTDVERTLTMPPGVDYEHGIGFFQAMLTDPDSVIWIVAHNSDFERAITTRTLKLPEPAKWLDTADLTLMRGLPAGADQAGQYLFNLPKDALGYQLMMRVCKPNKKGQIPIITDSIVQSLINYVFRDVEISERITERFGILSNPPREQEVRELSHDINEMGIGFDRHFAETLQRMDEWFNARACERVEEVTNGEVKRANLTQVDKLRVMINANLPEGYKLENMRASSLEEIIEEDEELGQNSPFSPEVIEVIKARQIIARAALAKVDTALRACCSDGRIRGQYRYWGAGTGRWCLAEGTEVLTRLGGAVAWVPIELVTVNHQVWDGEEWVAHEGVICNGEKETIEYAGLTATPDHVVYVGAAKSLSLQEARARQLPFWQGVNLPDLIPQREGVCGDDASGVEAEVDRPSRGCQAREEDPTL